VLLLGALSVANVVGVAAVSIWNIAFIVSEATPEPMPRWVALTAYSSSLIFAILAQLVQLAAFVSLVRVMRPFVDFNWWRALLVSLIGYIALNTLRSVLSHFA